MDHKSYSTFITHVLAVLMLTFLFSACNEKADLTQQPGIVTEQFTKWKALNLNDYSFILRLEQQDSGKVSRYKVEVANGKVIKQHAMDPAEQYDIEGALAHYAIYEMFLNIVYQESNEHVSNAAYHPKLHYPTMMKINLGQQPLYVNIEHLKATPFKSAGL